LAFDFVQSRLAREEPSFTSSQYKTDKLKVVPSIGGRSGCRKALSDSSVHEKGGGGIVKSMSTKISPKHFLLSRHIKSEVLISRNLRLFNGEKNDENLRPYSNAAAAD
jgi:hypothetical protein